MSLNGSKIGFAMTGSFFTIKAVIDKIKEIVEQGAEVIPIMSFNAYNIDTRYGKIANFISEIELITNHKVLNSFVEAEKLVNKKLIDILIIAPCTGNTLAKLANGITDTPVLMAVKSNLRNEKNVVIGIATDDGLSTNAVNIGKLLNTKNYFFIPFRQNNPITKPNSLMFETNYIIDTIEHALYNKQKQPLLL